MSLTIDSRQQQEVARLSNGESRKMEKKPINGSAKNGKRRQKERISKEAIGNPTNFIHNVHIGSESVPLDENVRTLIQNIGQDPDSMDADTRAFVREFMDNYQQQQKREKETTTITTTISNKQQQKRPINKPPPPPPAAVPHPTCPPPPPQRVTSIPAEKVTPTAVLFRPKPAAVVLPQPPPPPPINIKTPAAKQTPPPIPPTAGIHPQQNGCSPHPKTASGGERTPPPPPPPPSTTTLLPAKASSMCTDNETAKAQSQQQQPVDLLQQIRQGTKLRKVGMPADADKLPTPKKTTSPNLRDNMMEQIKQGANLKHVESNHQKSVVTGHGFGGNDIVNALMKALAARRRNINSEDSSTDSGSNDSSNEFEEK